MTFTEYLLYTSILTEVEVGAEPWEGAGLVSLLHRLLASFPRASQVALAVKNSPPNAGDVRDCSSIPGSGRVKTIEVTWCALRWGYLRGQVPW